MALDGFYISEIVKELKEALSETRCEKIHQPEKDEIILTFKNRKGSYRVLMTSSSESARIHLTDTVKTNPVQAPLFTMVLRKYLQSAKLKDISQYKGDRIVIFTFEAADELGFNSEYSLITEMMGKHSNIILVRNRDNRIIDCIKHVSSDVNTYRLLLPGAEYISPPSQNKTDPSDHEAVMNLGISESEIDEKFFMKRFTGISKQTSETLFRNLKKENTYNPDITLNEKVLDVLMKASDNRKYYVTDKKGIPSDLSMFIPSENETDHDADLEIKEFSSPSEALEYYLSRREIQIRTKERSSEILRIISNNTERVEKKINILLDVLKEAEEKDRFRNYGELIKANLYSINEGAVKAKVFDYFNEPYQETEIDLDPHKTPSENMQMYFRRYNKLKRSEESAKEQLSIANEELSYLNSVSESVMKSEDPADIADIRNELALAGYIRLRASKSKKKENPSKPMQFLSTEGIQIFVGKNNNQNDYLTTRFASPDDTWLHTKGYPGSHVIIKAKTFSDETLLEAANLAAYYSKAAEGTKVPVDYTLVRYVKKPNGSKPGMVTYSTNRTVYVDPDTPRISRV